VADREIDLALVVTNPPRPAGRGSRLRPTAVAEATRDSGLPLVEVPRIRDGEGFGALRDAVTGDGVEAFVVVAYGELLTRDVLDLPRLGCVNLHFSLLPRWRGAAPVQRAILEGDVVTGVTLMLMDEGLDTGPVLTVAETPIGARETAGELGMRLAGLGGRVLVEALPRLAAGALVPRAQSPGGTTAPKLQPSERLIDWASPGDEILRRVRAHAPEPGATTTFRGAPLKVLGAEEPLGVRGYVPAVEPGRLGIDPDGVPSVATSGVRLLEVAPAGRARMSGADWARGARFGPGESLS
jgi:methionyl-tRNA formyltransferase